MKESFSGKKKAVTFTYDDGVIQDRRLIEMFDFYGLKATFNVNSGLFGKDEILVREGVAFHHKRWEAQEVAEIYRGHELAVHTLTHANLLRVSDREIVSQVETDRENLCALTGREIRGMAYPGGGMNCDGHVSEIVRNSTGIAYARTTLSNHCFDYPENLFLWNPTVYHVMEMEEMLRLGKQFLDMDAETPQLFTVWGHSYEIEIKSMWREMEEFCRLISGKADIFYGTNAEILLD